ncbi:MAG: hypothetical protein NW226_03700 [Microscillaceae bacterium]|nr:hypothetical protein [Microscillaceae bacterium]
MKKTNLSSDNPKDRLEEFFQNRLENPDLEYNESQWLKMEVMLDQADPRKPFYKRIGFFWMWMSLLVLLLGNGILFYLNTRMYVRLDSKNTHHQERNSIHKDTVPNAQKSGKSHTAKPLTEAQRKPASSRETAQSLPEKLENGDNGVNYSQKNYFSSSDPTKGLRSGVQRLYFVYENTSISDSSMATRQTSASEIKEKTSFSRIQINRLESSAIKSSDILPPYNLSPVLMRATLANKSDSEKSMHVFSDYRWALGLSYAPEVSTTELNDYTKPGHRFGAAIEYFVRSRLSIQAGALFSKARYRAATEEYQVSSGYWAKYTNGEVPVSIDASCDIVDLSLQLKYYWLNRRLSRIFVSGGVSSYFLKREKYEYNFATYQPYRWDTQEIENQNRYWLGITQVSLGYEWAIHPKVSLQIEPFMKIPLGEIGFGKVKLFSSGVLFHLRYHLGKK